MNCHIRCACQQKRLRNPI